MMLNSQLIYFCLSISFCLYSLLTRDYKGDIGCESNMHRFSFETAMYHLNL